MMADRQRRRGIQHDFSHDTRNTQRPLATSAPDADTTGTVPRVYSSSLDDVYHNDQQHRGRPVVDYTNTHPIPSSHSLRNCELSRIRDSGYNTDVSPARTSSSTSTPAEHFSFSFDHPERMTIREDSSVGSPFSDGGSMPDHHDPDYGHRDQQHPASYYAEGQYLHPPSNFSTNVSITTPTSRATIFSVSPLESSVSRSVRRQSNSGVGYDNEGDESAHAFGMQQQQHSRQSVLSQSAPGSHDVFEGIRHSGIQQSPSVPVNLYQNDMTGLSGDVEDDDLDTVDGGRHGSSSSGEGLGVPLLPKSMSNSFQDIQGGDETESEDDEDNDVMTSPEEKEMEEMVLDSKCRRYSLRKRHYSGTDDEDSVSSTSITNITYRSSPGKSDAACAAGSDFGVHVPCSTSMPSLSRDYSDQMSPELASSIKNACQYMVGLNIGSSAEPEEEGEEGSVSEMRRRRSLDRALTLSSSVGFYLREEQELYVEGGRRLSFDTLEDNADSFDIGVDDNGNDSDEDVFTFDWDDIQEYNKSQDSLDRELEAQAQHRQRIQLHPSSGGDSQHGLPRRPLPPHYLSQHQHSAPATPKAPAAVPPRIVLERPPISPSSRTTGRKSKSAGGGGGKSSATRPGGRSIPAHVLLAGGARLPWDEGPGLAASPGGSGVGAASAASTQTPHRTSAMINEMVSTPVALPSEVRGTAFLHLRRGSVDMSTMTRNQPAPLPDIVPFARHRAQSAPNLHDLILRQRAQRTGRELRRLSDLFHENVVRRHSVHHEESQEPQSSSYPRMGPSYFLRERVTAFVFGTFRSRRRDSSVDDDSFPEVNDDDS